MQIGTPSSWNLTLRLLQPPAPPSFAWSSPTADQNTAATGAAAIDPAAEKTTSSIGLSPVVQTFLLRLQELGMTHISGTDGHDRLAGWSKSLVDGGDGNDTVDVWSDSVVDSGAGHDSIRAWSGSGVYGGAGNDQIDIWSDSAVDGGDGDDTIRAWSNTVVLGGNGNDSIDAWSDSQVDGGAGNDVISAWANSRVSGGEGDDWISAASNGLVDGGSGNDTLTVVGSVVSGGTGDDTIYDKHGSTILFSAGDGKDTIYASRDTTIRLGEGLTADKMQVEVSGSTATISFGDGSDQITLHLGHRAPVTVAFADGTTTEIKDNSPMIRLDGSSRGAPAGIGCTTLLDIELQDVVEAVEPAAQLGLMRGCGGLRSSVRASRGPVGLIHPTFELRSRDEGTMGGHAGHASVRYGECDRSRGARDVATGEDFGN